MVLLLALFFFYSCITTCEDVKKYYVAVHFEFVVTSKSDKNRGFVFDGYEEKGNFNEFRIPRFWDFYDFVEKGDSIIKKPGYKEIMLIKKDTTFTFPLMCGGQIVE